METCSTCTHFVWVTTPTGKYQQGQCWLVQNPIAVEQTRVACPNWIEKEEIRIANKEW